MNHENAEEAGGRSEEVGIGTEGPPTQRCPVVTSRFSILTPEERDELEEDFTERGSRIPELGSVERSAGALTLGFHWPGQGR